METIQVAPSGDLKIILLDSANSSNKRKRSSNETHDPSSKHVQQTFIVSSAVMRLASPVWNKMLDPQGRFRESFANGEVQFVEDDANTLLIILHIAHLQFRKLPKVLSFRGMVNLAVVCDKYDTTSLVRPWSKQWEAYLKKSINIEEPGREEYLFVAWTFGDLSSYEKIAKRLVYECSCDNKGRFIAGGYVLGKNLPPGSLDCILEAREETIRALLEMCSNLVESYESDEGFCQANHIPGAGRQCDTLVYGCLIKELKRLGLWPGPISPGDVDVSLTQLLKDLRSMTCFVLDGQHGRDHVKCQFTKYSRPGIDSIESRVSSGIDDPIRKHIQEQAKK